LAIGGAICIWLFSRADVFNTGFLVISVGEEVAT
jgi:hypothetical protein